jgi:hypothetical protein
MVVVVRFRSGTVQSITYGRQPVTSESLTARSRRGQRHPMDQGDLLTFLRSHRWASRRRPRRHWLRKPRSSDRRHGSARSRVRHLGFKSQGGKSGGQSPRGLGHRRLE